MAHKQKLLYVDDEEANILLFTVNFRDRFDLITANSGQEGLDILERNSDISIVVCDLRMPFMSGLEMVSIAHNRYPDKHYFILSGIDVSDEIKEYMDKKIISDYFCKPIRIDLINNRLSSISNSKSA